MSVTPSSPSEVNFARLKTACSSCSLRELCLPVGLADGGGWGDTTIELVGQPLVDVITGRCYEGGTTSLAHLLDTYPVALLAPPDTAPEPGLPEAGP